MTRKRLIGRLAGVILGCGLLACGGVVMALPASAHNGGLSGAATCQTDGTYTVAWTLTTTNVPTGDTATVTINNWNPAGSTITGLPIASLAQNASATIVQTGVPGSAHEADLGVNLDWSGADTFHTTAGGIAPLAGTCAVVTPPTTTVPVTTPTTTSAPPTSSTASSATLVAPTAPASIPTPTQVQPAPLPNQLPNIAPAVNGVTQGNG